MKINSHVKKDAFPFELLTTVLVIDNWNINEKNNKAT